MNKLILKSLGVTFLALAFTAGLFAQDVKKESKEENEIKIKVYKDDKVVLDTTFTMDGNLDQDYVNKLVKELDGDKVKVEVNSEKEITVEGFAKSESASNIFVKSFGDDAKVVKYHVRTDKGDEFEHNVDVKVDGKVIYVTTEGDEGEHVINIKKVLGDEEDEDVKVMVVKKDGKGETFDILLDGEHLDHKEGKVIVKKGKDISWVHKDADEVIELKEYIKGENVFIKEKKSAITLKHLEGDQYRLEINTDDTEPVDIEVFNSEGKRLYSKKVKEYYGRFLKEIELKDNESAFFTVKVTQGEKEIIGEFEFK